MRYRKATLALSLLLTLVLSAGAAGQQSTPADRRAATLAHGDPILAGVELEVTTPIAELLADPEAYDGKLVQIEGVVVGLCQNMGCWAALDDGAGNQVNVKVEDGVIDFREITAAEHYMVAEGVFQVVGEHGAQVFIMEHGAFVSTD